MFHPFRPTKDVAPWIGIGPAHYDCNASDCVQLCTPCQCSMDYDSVPSMDMYQMMSNPSDCFLCQMCPCGGKHRVYNHDSVGDSDPCLCNTIRIPHKKKDHYCLNCYAPTKPGMWFCYIHACTCGSTTHDFDSHTCSHGMTHYYDSWDDGYDWKRDYDYQFCCDICPCVDKDTPPDLVHPSCKHVCRVCSDIIPQDCTYCTSCTDHDQSQSK